jgi:transposase
MSRPIAPLITEEQKMHLESTANSRETSHSLVQRSQIVLKASEGMSNKAISKSMGINEETVGMWRRRWFENREELDKYAGKPKLLKKALKQLLSDKKRLGSPCKFSSEEICQLIALACETPPEHLSHWTRKELARNAIERGIVESISASTMGRFLKSGGFKTPS